MTSPTYAIITKTDDKGTIPEHPIFQGYQLEGWIWRDNLRVGMTLAALRVKKNGINRLGSFETSTVTELAEFPDHLYSLVGTRNSYYRIDWKPNVPYDEATIRSQLLIQPTLPPTSPVSPSLPTT